MKTNFMPRVSEVKKPESFSSVLFPTLVEARKQFPAQMTFKTGIQDFKNVPMLRLEHSPREFSAEVNGFYDITSTPNAVFSIKCDPQGTEVSRLHLMIRPGVLMGITWKFPRNLSGTETRCVERRAAEQVEDLNSTYELWEITFPQPVHDPFVFQLALLMLPSSSQSLNSDAAASEQTAEQTAEQAAEQAMEQETAGQLNRELAADYLRKNSQERGIWWRKHFPNGLNLPLIDVTDAVKCTGSVMLQNDVTDEVLVETQEMIPSILSREETSGILFKTASEDCGLYRYTPHAISNTPRPQLKLQWRNQSIGVQKAWIWKEFCQSQFFTNGTILHSATFKIENIDAQQLELSIRSPYKPPVEILGIIVNGFQVPFETLVKSETVTADSKAAGSQTAGSADSKETPSSAEHKPSEISVQSGSPLPKTSRSDSGIPTKGIRAVASSAPGEDFRLVIPFPVWQRENEVIVQWLERKPAWSIFTTLEPPEISTNLLVLQKSWQAWIPENFVPFGEDEDFRKEEPEDGFSGEGTAETGAESEKGSGSENVRNDSLLVRLFGPFRLGKNIFSRPENLTLSEIESPIPLDSRSLEKLSSFGLDEKSGGQSSRLAILSQERNTHSVVGWNSFTQSKGKPIFVIYGNILEASRWFLLLLVGFLASWVLVPYRLVRVWICGLAGAFCMLVPLAWTPFFSGIFLGMGTSFINSSLRRHIRYVSENRKPVISVKAPSESAHSSKAVKSPSESARSQGAGKSRSDHAQASKTTETLEGSSIILTVEPQPELKSTAGSTRKKEEKS